MNIYSSSNLDICGNSWWRG